MNKDIKIYTDLDGLFDYREGILSSMLPKGTTFEQAFGNTYCKRTIEVFNKPELGITNEKFIERYKNRNNSDFATYKQSELLTSMLPMILAFEGVIGLPVDIKHVKLTVNIWPYKLDDELIEDMKIGIKSQLRYSNEVIVVDIPDNELLPVNFAGFDHVFKYNFLLTGWNEEFFKKVPPNLLTNTNFFVPCVKIADKKDAPESPQQAIEKLSILCNLAFGNIIPVALSEYDYIGSVIK